MELTSLHLASGADLARAIRRAAAGVTIVLAAGGSYRGGYVEGHAAPIHVIGNGARVAGGLKFEGCGPLTLEGFALPDAPHHALMCVECESLTARGLQCNSSQGSGILTARMGLIKIRWCTARGNVEHGCYVSEGGDHIRIGGNAPGQGNDFRRNHRCGCQVNANPNRSRDVKILGNDCRDSFNAGVQLAGVTGGTVAGNRVRGCRFGTTVWDDGEGDRLACRDIDLTEQSGPFNIARNSTGVRLLEGV